MPDKAEMGEKAQCTGVYMSILSPFPKPHGAARGFFNSLLVKSLPLLLLLGLSPAHAVEIPPICLTEFTLTSGKPGPCQGSQYRVLSSVVLSGEQAHRRCPTLRLRTGLVRAGLLLEVIENPLDHQWVLDAGNDIYDPAAGRTGLNVDAKNTIYSV
jgi:hypothetical protein